MESPLVKENLLTKENLKNFIQDFFIKNPSKSKNLDAFPKKDIEGFLTNFTYNKHGETAISDIASLIYE